MLRRIATVLACIAVAVAVVVATGSGGSQSGAKTFKMAFDNAFGLTQGGDLRIGGVKAGQTTGFTISNGPACQDTSTKGIKRTCAIVTAQINTPGFQSIRADAECAIRQQSLIGEYYVDCQPGNSKTQLKSGATLSAKQTQSTIPADLVGDVMRLPYRDRLRLIIAELGTGLAGRPQDISELLHKAHPGLRETDKVLRMLANQDTIIKNFITNSNTVVRQLDINKSALQDWIKQAGTTAQISATRRGAIAAGFQRLPTFLDELRANMSHLGQLTQVQTPLLRDLNRAAPDLNTFFAELGPFTQASRPAFRSLGATSDAGRRAFTNSSQEIRELRALAAGAPTTAKPLRQFLQTADNRARSTEPNANAKKFAPPAPDPTSASHGQGYTAMEAFWNYWYYQAQALSLFDQYGHVLRGVAILDPTCGQFLANLRGPDMPYGNSKNVDTRRRCNSYLGPTQPGVTTPDYTPTTSNGKVHIAGASGTTSGKQPKLAATKPLPGQPNYSVPHVTPSASTQELLQALQQQAGGAINGTSAPSGSPVGGASAEQILNYLLAP